MTEDKIIDKIKKLLALASSPNENEAQLAMERAQQLMADYCISRDQFFDSQTGPNLVFREMVQSEVYKPSIYASRGLQKELPYIVQTISKIFGCMVLVQFNEPRIYGFQTNIEITKYTLDSILNQAKVDYLIGYKKTRTITFDETFWKAFSDTLQVRFSKHVEASNGLVVYDPVRAEVQAQSKDIFISKTGTQSSAGVEYGTEAGSSVQLRSGVEAGNQGKLIQ